MSNNNTEELTFEDFKKMAGDPSLSEFEKIGFPDSYRQGKANAIWLDIRSKLANLDKKNQIVLDIGPGCSELPQLLIEYCRTQGHHLILVDSAEMLKHLPDAPFIEKISGYFPRACENLFDKYARQINCILTYSVFHYVFTEGNVFEFLDRSLGLLADGGEMLIGDIPNVSKRKRFFHSTNGIRFHQEFMHTADAPVIEFNNLEPFKIDDAAIASLLLRSRAQGFDAYWLSQHPDLPMANRREDVLIVKP